MELNYALRALPIAKIVPSFSTLVFSLPVLNLFYLCMHFRFNFAHYFLSFEFVFICILVYQTPDSTIAQIFFCLHFYNSLMVFFLGPVFFRDFSNFFLFLFAAQYSSLFAQREFLPSFFRVH
jgi:hypothetical protein